MAMDFLAGAPIKELQDDRASRPTSEVQRPKGLRGRLRPFQHQRQDARRRASRSGSKHGERVLFHVLNASAGEIRSLALPGHVFRVVALDGNPVPTPADVPVLWLGTAERISAIVEMNRPGVWVHGRSRR